MGGFFMNWKLVRLALGWVCGYLVVNWLPEEFPFKIDEYVVGVILNPLEFLWGALALVIGMYSLGDLLKNGFMAIIKILKGKKTMPSDIILGIGSFSCFIALLPLGEGQTAVFFCFCLLYGMISFSPSRAKMEI
jgi:hypothetical protein